MSHCTEGYLKRKPTAKDGLRVGLPGRVGSIHGEQDGLADQLATISIDIYHYQYIYLYICQDQACLIQYVSLFFSYLPRVIT
nr:hypothetical protein Q903MT_gene6517 [Picea sitchensis]